MGNFWDSLKSVGLQTVEKLSAPISTGIARTFGNIVQGTQLKVAAVTDKIVKGTDPIKNANSPAIPPTTGSSLNPPALTIAGINVGIVAAAVLIVLVVYYLGRKA